MKEQKQPKFTYMRLPPSKWVFKFPRMRDWIYEKIAEKFDPDRALVLNLFAGQTLLPDIREYRVDTVRQFKEKDEVHYTHPDYVGDAYDFVQSYNELLGAGHARPFSVALLDPPYNVRKAREKYEGRYIGSFTKIKNKLSNVLTGDSRVITWGYSSVGMSESRGYGLTEVVLICHSGDHNDTIVTVEDRII